MRLEEGKKELAFLKENVPIQYYAEVMLGIVDWKQSRGLLQPKITFKAVDANDYSSLRINPSKNSFVRYSGKGRNPHGSIIDFIMNVEDCDTGEAVRKLKTFVEDYLPELKDGTPFENIRPEYKYTKEKVALTADVSAEFVLPNKGKNFKRLFAYMIGKRMIEKPVYDYFVKSGFLYQDWRGSACFVSYDDNGIPVFGCIRDTNWNERITYGVEGSSVNHAFYINNHRKSLIVTEAVIDAMALMSILSLNGERYKKFNYLALTGVSKICALKYHLEQDPTIKKVFLGFDNDEAGRKGDKAAREMLKEMGWEGEIETLKPSFGKDFNDALIHKKEMLEENF